MMHPYLPFARQPAIPAVGFVQSAFAGPQIASHGGPDVPASVGFLKGRDVRIEYLERQAGPQDQRYDPPTRLVDYFAAAFIVMSVGFGPAVSWLLVR